MDNKLYKEWNNYLSGKWTTKNKANCMLRKYGMKLLR